MTKTIYNIKGYENRIKTILSAMFGMSIDQINNVFSETGDCAGYVFETQGKVYDISIDPFGCLLIEKHIGNYDIKMVARVNLVN
jgi:hypothetical protein